eukprot:gene2778-29660_t
MVGFLLLTQLLGCVGAGRSITTTRIMWYDGNGTSMDGDPGFYSILKQAADSAFPDGFEITNMTAGEVRTIKPGNFAVVVFPGGSGRGESTAIGEEGMDAVKAHLVAGGGYIGTCGGAFLAIQHLKLYGEGPAGLGPTTQEPWDRGHGVVQVEFTKEGAETLGLQAATYADKNVSIMYWQGPIVKAAAFPPNVTQLSYYRTEIHSLHPNQTTGEMVNTPAMTSLDDYGGKGKGRVFLNSPHPELEPLRPEIYVGELRWVTRSAGRLPSAES